MHQTVTAASSGLKRFLMTKPKVAITMLYMEITLAMQLGRLSTERIEISTRLTNKRKNNDT